MHANGAREEFNNYLLDGVDNNDPYLNRLRSSRLSTHPGVQDLDELLQRRVWPQRGRASQRGDSQRQAGRNILRGPGLASFDLSLVRRFHIRESSTLSFEAQAFNALNRVNFALPQAIVDQTGSFGRIFSARPPRQIQFALRYNF
jgi:hypothetical protein